MSSSRSSFAVVVVAATTATSVSARAHEPVILFSDARREIVAGDLVTVRRRLQAVVVGEGVPEEARARAAELVLVADQWMANGRPNATTRGAPRAIDGGEPGVPDAPLSWEDELSSARAELIAGAFADAGARLDRLVSVAPNVLAAARATELRALARDASGDGPREPAPSPVAVTPDDPSGPPPAAAGRRVDFSIAAEVSARSIYGVSMIGGGANAGIDVTSREGRYPTAYARASFDALRTTLGLSVAAIYGAGGLRWEVVPRLWLGGGARVGHVFVTRVTTRGSLSSPLLGVEGVLVFDAVRSGSSFAMFVFGTPFAELLPLGYGGTVGAGVRW